MVNNLNKVKLKLNVMHNQFCVCVFLYSLVYQRWSGYNKKKEKSLHKYNSIAHCRELKLCCVSCSYAAKIEHLPRGCNLELFIGEKIEDNLCFLIIIEWPGLERTTTII